MRVREARDRRRVPGRAVAKRDFRHRVEAAEPVCEPHPIRRADQTDDHVLAASGERHIAGRDVLHHVHRVESAAVVDDGIAPRGRAEIVDVVALAAVERVLAGAAVEDVVAAFPEQRVVARAALETVAGAVAAQRVVRAVASREARLGALLQREFLDIVRQAEVRRAVNHIVALAGVLDHAVGRPDACHRARHELAAVVVDRNGGRLGEQAVDDIRVVARPPRHHVDARATVQVVVVRRDEKAVRTAEEPVVASAAEERVVARAAVEHVVPRAPVEQVVVGEERAAVPASVAPVSSVPAAAGARHQSVVAAVQEVVALLAKELVVARAAVEQIVAAAAENRIRVGRQDLGDRAAVAVVGRLEEGVVAAVEHVAVIAPEDEVVAGASIDGVRTAATLEIVVPVVAEDPVGRIVAGTGQARHRSALREIAGQCEVLDRLREHVRVGTRHHVVALARHLGDHIEETVGEVLVVPRAAGHGVQPRAAVDHVVTAAAQNRVVALASVDGVVALARVDRVVAAVAVDPVVAAECGDDVCALVADDQVVRVVAGAVDILRAGEIEILQRVAQSVGDTRVHRVVSAGTGLVGRVAEVVHEVSVVALTPGHEVGARAAVEHIAVVTTGEDIVTLAPEERIVALAAVERIVARARVQQVASGTARESVIARIAEDDVVELVAGSVERLETGLAGQRQVLDVGRERVGDARTHQVVPTLRIARLGHEIARVVDHVDIAAHAAAHRVGAFSAVE